MNPPGDGAVGRIEHPDLIGSSDGERTLQGGVDLVPRIACACARLVSQCFDVHVLPKRAPVPVADLDRGDQHPGTHKRMLPMPPGDPTHEVQAGVGGRPGQVVRCPPTDLVGARYQQSSFSACWSVLACNEASP